jgi:hypothetical protein
VTFGHPSGTLRVGAQAGLVDGQWTVTKAIMSRSARVLMEGKVRVPAECIMLVDANLGWHGMAPPARPAPTVGDPGAAEL